MCGISGIAFKDTNHPVSRPDLVRMTRLLEHRGPDDEGYFTGPGTGLGMRRLAIIDLDGGKQPISNEDGTVNVVANGEIYNYRELTEKLKGLGHSFKTKSDTEVIVHLYEQYGDACVDHLRGMFAFALWDQRKGRLVIARDRVGKKPLFYTCLKDRLLFASEIKSILAHPGVTREVDTVAWDQYMTFEYVPGERTMFRGIQKLLPGQVFRRCLTHYKCLRRFPRAQELLL